MNWALIGFAGALWIASLAGMWKLATTLETLSAAIAALKIQVDQLGEAQSTYRQVQAESQATRAVVKEQGNGS